MGLSVTRRTEAIDGKFDQLSLKPISPALPAMIKKEQLKELIKREHS